MHSITVLVDLDYRTTILVAMKFFIIVVLLFNSVNPDDKYITKIKSIKQCINPIKPYAEDFPIKVTLEIKNIMGVPAVVGNLTVKEDYPADDMKWYLANGVETQQGIDWMYELKDLDCRSQFIQIVSSMIKGAITDKCVIKKGIHSFKNINVNKLDHAVHRGMTRQFGNFRIKLMFYTKTQTVFCVEFSMNISRAKNSKH